MSLEMRQEAVTPGTLGEHARTSIAFTVDRMLEVADRFAYPGLPNEVQLLWWKRL